MFINWNLFLQPSLVCGNEAFVMILVAEIIAATTPELEEEYEQEIMFICLPSLDCLGIEWRVKNTSKTVKTRLYNGICHSFSFLYYENMIIFYHKSKCKQVSKRNYNKFFLVKKKLPSALVGESRQKSDKDKGNYENDETADNSRKKRKAFSVFY